MSTEALSGTGGEKRREKTAPGSENPYPWKEKKYVSEGRDRKDRKIALGAAGIT